MLRDFEMGTKDGSRNFKANWDLERSVSKDKHAGLGLQPPEPLVRPGACRALHSPPLPLWRPGVDTPHPLYALGREMRRYPHPPPGARSVFGVQAAP